MLTDRDRARYAQGIVNVLRVVGPQPRGDVIRILHTLDVGETDAEDVLRYALAHRAVVTDRDMVRAGLTIADAGEPESEKPGR